jgi:ParB family chromosome partitioning protein
MTLPAGFPYPLKQEVQIPLEQIIPNPNQPRKLEDKEAIQLLAASLRAKGQEVAARVRPLTEAERAAHPGAWVMLIGGHGRREAALLNGFKTLKCTIEDITPEEAISSAARDNNIRDMHWWEWYLVFEAMDKTSRKSQREIADELGKSQTKVNWGLKITKTLNSAARALVQENLQKTLKNDDLTPITKNKGFSITESHLLALADLEDPNQVQQALQVVLDDYLTADQAKKLVEWVKDGNDPAGFSATKPTPKPTVSKAATPHVASHVAGAKAPQESAQSKHVAQPVASAQIPTASTPGTLEKAGWDILAGLPLATQIRAKIKKGERPTWGERFILVADLLWRVFVWVAKHLWKLIHWFAKGLWKKAEKIAKHPLKTFGEAYQMVWAVLFFAFFLLGAWMLFDHYMDHDAWKPVRTISSWVFANRESEKPSPVVVATPMPTPQQQADPSLGSAQSNLAPQPVVSSQMPVSVVQADTKGNINEPLAQSTHVAPLSGTGQLVTSQQTPTPKPQGDLLTQAAGAAPGVAQAANGVKSLLGL